MEARGGEGYNHLREGARLLVASAESGARREEGSMGRSKGVVR